MATKMTINRVAPANRQERRTTRISKRVSADANAPFVQYDYRHTDGELFSCVKPTLDECRAARDKWLTAKERKEDKR